MARVKFMFIESLMLRSRPDREYVDTAAIVANRKRISAILQRQEPLDASFEAAFAGMTFDERPSKTSSRRGNIQNGSGDPSILSQSEGDR